MDYTKLDARHKRHFLTNCQALWTSAKCLERLTGVSGDEWMTDIANDAYQIVDSMSDREVNEAIAELEQRSNNERDSIICVKQKKS